MSQITAIYHMPIDIACLNNNNNNNTRFDTRCISSDMRIQSAVKCHCYLIQKQHTTVMQPAGAVPLSQRNTETQGTMTSHNI
jgi:hypothetical protein